MVKLRLRRTGRKKHPVYKIVAADSRSPRDGRFIESLGTYNPNINPAQVEVKENRVFHWLKSGALPTPTVRNLLSRKGILLKMNLQKRGFDENKIEEEFNKWMAVQTSKIQKSQEKKLRRKVHSKAKSKSEKPESKEVQPVPETPE